MLLLFIFQPSIASFTWLCAYQLHPVPPKWTGLYRKALADKPATLALHSASELAAASSMQALTGPDAGTASARGQPVASERP